MTDPTRAMIVSLILKCQMNEIILLDKQQRVDHFGGMTHSFICGTLFSYAFYNIMQKRFKR